LRMKSSMPNFILLLKGSFNIVIIGIRKLS